MDRSSMSIQNLSFDSARPSRTRNSSLPTRRITQRISCQHGDASFLSADRGAYSEMVFLIMVGASPIRTRLALWVALCPRDWCAVRDPLPPVTAYGLFQMSSIGDMGNFCFSIYQNHARIIPPIFLH
ncbi:unnamed protein product [Tuber aestivum]|uniref:Uncharacterized protein n=1 Tax=Tuber aestivum TaxID=59557 RepID=A0A292PZE5_9PEZI|nr:unnamed protein product [Tuber aestivum]